MERAGSGLEIYFNSLRQSMEPEKMKSTNKRRDTGSFLLRGILLPGVALLVCIVVIAFVYSTGLVELAEQRAVQMLLTTAEVQTRYMDQRLKSNFEQLSLLSAGIEWDSSGIDDEDMQHLLSDASGVSDFDVLAVCGFDGELLDQHGRTANCSDRLYFQKTSTGEACAEYLQAGRISGDSVFVFAVPVYVDGEIVGTAIATRSADDVADTLSVQIQAGSTFALICYDDGEILSRSHSASDFIDTGKNIDDYFRGMSSKHGDMSDIEGNADDSGLDIMLYEYNGERYYGISSDLDLDGMMLFSVANESYVTAVTAEYYRHSAVMIALVILVTLMLSATIVVHVCIYLRAAHNTKTEQQRKLDEYNRMQGKQYLKGEDVIVSAKLNLTKDTAGGFGGECPEFKAPEESCAVNEFLSLLCSCMYPDDERLCRDKFSREGIIRAYERGMPVLQDDILLHGRNGEYIWAQLTVNTARNPLTDDLEAIEYAVDINRKKRLEQIALKMIDEDLDAMALIDVGTCRAMRIKALPTGELEPVLSRNDDLTYDQLVRQDFPKIMESHDYAQMGDALKLSTVMMGLEESDSYDVTLRLMSGSSHKLKYLKMRYTYLSERREAIMLTCEDITDIVSSGSDVMTGLYNFTGFYKRVEEWIKAHPGRRYRIHRYDLDGFKNVNGTFGYDAGNRLLINFGRYMRMNDTEDSFSAHLNADHFVRFSSDDSISPQECYERFLAYFKDYELHYPLPLHIGVYDLCEPDCDFYSMSYKALLALQSIKGDFSTRIAYYKPSMLTSTQARVELLGDAEKAISEEQFKVWFQPQVDYAEGVLTGAEALIRWDHPEKGMIPPGEFLPLFERSRLITKVDKYMWDRSCRYIRHWLDMGLNVPVSVNISRIDIYDMDLRGFFTELVKKYDIPTTMLRLEITESFYMDNPRRMISTVDSFREAGFIVEMDDFGAGYSSLNILKDLNIDVLKLDMRFLSDFDGTDNKGGVILRSVVQLAQDLKMKVIAEGVETREQAEFLKSIGCTCMQGYYFSKPIPAEKFESRMIENKWDR